MPKLKKPTLEDTIILATKLHKGQVDKRREPYILHPLAVMLDGKNKNERITGVLHDVMEDCGIKTSYLHELGYSEKIIKALELLTKLPEEENDYPAFINRIGKSGNELAISVKINDIKNNLDKKRFPRKPKEKDFKRRDKYLWAIFYLEKLKKGKV